MAEPAIEIESDPTIQICSFKGQNATDTGSAPESSTYLRAAAAVQKLVSPAEMGELFKVLLLSRSDADWPSLAVGDMTHRL